MRGKGQAFMSDFAVSMALFGIILAAFFIPWNAMIESDQRFSEEQLMKTEAERIASLLISTPGYPSDWEDNTSGLIMPGFSESRDNIISLEKLKAFSNLDYDRQTTITQTQNFTLEFRESESGRLLNYSGGEDDELGKAVGSEPIAYMVQSGSEFTDLKLLDNLNNSKVEWYFYFPSTSNQDELGSLTAEEVYTNEGSGREMMERMITDSADQGWKYFEIGGRIEASAVSMPGDLDNDGGTDLVYRYDDRMYVRDFEEDKTRSIETVSEFSRLGGIADFTSQEGNEIAYKDSDDAISFYNWEADSVTTTGVEVNDIGGSVEIDGERVVFFTDDDDNLAYYSEESGVTTTSVNGGLVGGTGDIDGDNELELAYTDTDDNLAFYQIQQDVSESTEEELEAVGGIDDGRAVMISNSNDDAGYWNYSDSSFRPIGFPGEKVSSFVDVDGRERFLYLDTEENQDLAFYDIDNGMKQYIRDDSNDRLRADGTASYSIQIPGYGESIAYIDGSGYINFYLINEGITASIDKRANYLGGAGDLDGEGNQELAFVDKDGGDLEYYDFESAQSFNAVQDGSNVRARESGESADFDGDEVDETAIMVQSTSNLGYYDFEENEITDLGIRIESLGGAADIDLDGTPDITYVKDTRNLAYYSVGRDEETETGAPAEYAGGAGDIAGDSQPEIFYRNADQQTAYYNPDTGEAIEEETRVRAVGSMMEIGGDEGFDGIGTHNDNNLGYYDFSLDLKRETVIAENVDVQEKDISNGEILGRAVDQGMTYYQSKNDHSILREIFGISTQDPGSDTGEVIQTQPLISDEFEEGDEMTFSDLETAINPIDVDESYITSTQSPESCMACEIDYGDGKVYYLSGMNIEGSDNHPSLEQPENSIITEISGPEPNPFNLGIDSDPEAETVIGIDRQVIVNKSGKLENAEMNYVVWR